ncbi:tyrosine-protein phosphatase 69D-like [Trichonephila clavipes]|nr:tyrosine-protein phosphatase 69D-like [Trichonephila clavipes]
MHSVEPTGMLDENRIGKQSNMFHCYKRDEATHTFNFINFLERSCVSILEHIVEPPVVSNCSSVTLTCRVDTGAPNVEVWWTFRGENASKLPDTTIVTDNADKGEWQLELKCPTLEHKGTYACNAQGRNESEVVYRKEALLRIYGA